MGISIMKRIGKCKSHSGLEGIQKGIELFPHAVHQNMYRMHLSRINSRNDATFNYWWGHCRGVSFEIQIDASKLIYSIRLRE
jgi:hypothetical protein